MKRLLMKYDLIKWLAIYHMGKVDYEKSPILPLFKWFCLRKIVALKLQYGGFNKNENN